MGAAPTWAQHWLSRTLPPSSEPQKRAQERGVARVVAACWTRACCRKPCGGAERIWANSTARSSGQRHPSAAALQTCCGDGQSVLLSAAALGMGWLVGTPLLGHYGTDPRRRPAPLTCPPLWPRQTCNRIVARAPRRVAHGRIASARNPVPIRGQYRQRSQPSSRPLYPGEWAQSHWRSLHSAARLGAARARNYLQRIGRAGAGMAMPGRHHRHRHPRPLLLPRSREAMLRGRVSPPGCLSRCCRHPAAPACSPSPWIAGAERHRCPGPASQLKTRPPIAVEKAGQRKDLPDTFPYTWLQWWPAPSGASVGALFFCSLPRPAC